MVPTRLTPLKQYICVFVISVVLVSGIDLVTNRVDVTRYGWDYVQYISMAENGVFNNTFISAPFAYRVATPLAARFLITTFPISTETAFTIITYLGLISSLMLVFVLAKRFNDRFWVGLVALLAVGLSFYHVKYPVFDVYRPDPLAYPVIILAMLALFDKRYRLCILLSVPGALIREFVIIPAAIVLVLWGYDYIQMRSRKTLISIILLSLSIVGVFVVPRLLITAQPGESIIVYVKTVLHPLRNINIVFSLASYLLPGFLLFTPDRFRRLMDELKRRELLGILALYICFVMILTDIGGTDVPRFLTFLFIPLIIGLAVFQNDDVNPLEIVFMLIALLIFNRIFWEIPFDTKENFRAFYGGISTQIDLSTLERTAEIIAYCLSSLLIRKFVRSRRLILKVAH